MYTPNSNKINRESQQRKAAADAAAHASMLSPPGPPVHFHDGSASSSPASAPGLEQQLNSAFSQRDAQMQEMQRTILQLAAQLQQQQQPGVAAAQTGSSVVVNRALVPPPPRWAGNVAGATKIDDWLEEVEDWHDYNGADSDQDKIKATVVLLTDAARRDYATQKQQSGPAATWEEFKQRMRLRWRHIANEFTVREELNTLIKRGPAMKVSAYCDKFQHLAAQLPKQDVGTQLFNFGLGLPPSFRVRVVDKKPTSLLAAIQLVCETDTTRQAVGLRPVGSASGSGSNSSPDAMDLSAIELSHIEPADREAALAALNSEGLVPIDTSAIVGSSSGPAPSLQQLIDKAVQAQLNALKSNDSRRSNGNKGSHWPQGQEKKQGSSKLKGMPAAILNLRRTYGYCMHCGKAKYDKEKHHAGNCPNPRDITALPPGCPPLQNFH